MVLPEAEVAEHPAAVAWRTAIGSSGNVAQIVALKAQTQPTHKSGVYRFVGVDRHGSVIAKRALRGTAELERAIRRDVLARLPLPQLAEYAFLVEPDGQYCWTFLEDAGDVRCTPEIHGSIAARWLVTLHREAAALDPSGWPDRGPADYLAHLHVAQLRIADGLLMHQQVLSPQDRALLQHLWRHCSMLIDRWSDVEAMFQGIPRTLAHGDFVPKNLRIVRSTGPTESLYALDWETAGLAPPVADLAELVGKLAGEDRSAVIESYRSALGNWWPEAARDRTVIERAAGLGRLLRLIVSIRWAGERLPYAWIDRAIQKLHVYEPPLAAELQRLVEWE